MEPNSITVSAPQCSSIELSIHDLGCKKDYKSHSIILHDGKGYTPTTASHSNVQIVVATPLMMMVTTNAGSLTVTAAGERS